ncbi:MAG: M42 family peptidase [Clostridia bacterium]|nr:M42 family peptidase [Clostridia bacterium]
MNIKNTLIELAKASSAPGQEYSVAPLAEKMLSEYMPVSTDNLGNVVGHKEGEGKHILLDAHLDSIGMVVTAVEENGFLRVDKCGGIDIRTIAAQDVIVHGREDLFGVVTSIPPHLSKGDEKKAAGFDEIMIDTGIDGDRIFSLVAPGDRVTLKAQYGEMANGTLSGAYFDNKAGVCAVLRCLEILKEADCKNEITVLFSAQEEAGLVGARVGGFNCNADECICVDVSFAKTNATPKSITSSLGEGTMIGFAPVLSYEMSRNLETLAKENNIPYQLEVMSSSTGTNADVIAVSAHGKKTALLSFPLKNMHTAVEVIDPVDIEYTAQLMAKYILTYGGADNA